MKKYQIRTAGGSYWQNLLTRVVLVLLCVLIIVWFLPRSSGPQFIYESGKPWKYNSLIAKFDYPIYKTDEAIRAEQDSILRAFEPYYVMHTEVEEEMLAKFSQDFSEGTAGLNGDFIALIRDRLHRLYSVGIMRTTEYSKLSTDSTKMVRVVSGMEATSTQIGCLYSELGAYEQLFLDEHIAAQRQLLQRYNLNEYIVPNLVYDKNLSESELTDQLGSVAIASGMVMANQKIIDRGEMVDEHKYLMLKSLERELKRRSADDSEITSTIAGQTLYVAMLLALLTIYLALFRKDYFEKPRSILMLYAMVTMFPVLVSLMERHNVLTVYILPLTIAPVFIRVFLDSRTAFISHTVMILLCAVAVKNQFDFIIIEMVAGMVAIYSLRELSQRTQLFRTALLVTAACSAMYFSIQLMHLTEDNKITILDADMYKYFIVGGVLLLFAYPLMVVVEKMFGFVSGVTLVELSNTSRELLRRMSEVAPGTFQHSIMVSNLAAAIANKIDADAQLVRTGALYHDIGKMQNPAFYTENQAGLNPLEKMPRIEAAQIVISHVTEGLKLAERNNLPGVIRDFIATHHGAGMTKYFYISYKNEHPDQPVDDNLFRYPGPNPFTREQAILMMADTAEAASRSLKEYTEESITALINQLLDQQVADGFFRDCPITFHDINMAKQVLIERLKSIYHTRISYPKLQRKDHKGENKNGRTEKDSHA